MTVSLDKLSGAFMCYMTVSLEKLPVYAIMTISLDKNSDAIMCYMTVSLNKMSGRPNHTGDRMKWSRNNLIRDYFRSGHLETKPPSINGKLLIQGTENARYERFGMPGTHACRRVPSFSIPNRRLKTWAGRMGWDARAGQRMPSVKGIIPRPCHLPISLSHEAHVGT